MENINLVDLPLEILLKIAGKLINRWNLSLVNWKFYEICSILDENRLRIKLIDVSKFSMFDK